MTQISTRFAPSPTGSLHIGGVRTALFNWLYAERMKGSFRLRIEDTDQERSTKQSEEEILASMQWLGMESQGEVLYQSKRNAVYQAYIDELLKSGKAYRCTCSSERLDQVREECRARKEKPKYDRHCQNKEITAECGEDFVVRIRSGEAGSLSFTDTLRGKVEFQRKELDDFIIQRSDGSFMYNFVVAIDDHAMGITHVIRGNDHLSNTPKQLLVYDALGFEPPSFTHLSMILNQKRKKLSKRDGVGSVLEYKKAGYLPDAVMNFLVRLGWSHGDQELFSIEELKTLFDIKGLNKADAVFNQEKFLWVNAQHIKMASPQALYHHTKAWLEINEKKSDILSANEEAFKQNVALFQPKAKTLEELYNSMLFLYTDKLTYNKEESEKLMTSEVRPILEELSTSLGTIDFTHEEIEQLLKAAVTKEAIKFKVLAQPLRYALTGSGVSLGIYDLLLLLGKEKSIERLKSFLTYTA